MSSETYMRISRIVGWKKKRELTYPTFEQVFREADYVKLLEWYRFLDDPKTEDEKTIVEAIGAKLNDLWND